MSEMGMVERVARAICASMGYEPDGFDLELLPSNESEDGWKNWFSFKPEARTAILAMREPTATMVGLVAYGDYIHDNGEYGSAFTDRNAVAVWRDMIGAALSEAAPSTPE